MLGSYTRVFTVSQLHRARWDTFLNKLKISREYNLRPVSLEKMTLLTWSNLELVRENFGYPADGTVSAILFITGISWQKRLGAHLARICRAWVRACCFSSLGARGISILSFFFQFLCPYNYWQPLKTTVLSYVIVGNWSKVPYGSFWGSLSS